MRRSNSNARRKLFVSLAVLGIVLVIAAVAQFTGWNRGPNPYASVRPGPTGPAPKTVDGRAVFGDSRPEPTAASPRPKAEAPLETTRSRTEQVENGGIDQVLDRWRLTVLRGDVEGQTALYGPKLERFFRERNVSNDGVKRVKSSMMRLYPTVSKYDISDVKVEKNDGKEAVVSFRKEWDMNGQKRFSGAERQRLKLRRIAGDWKIVSEEETKVYWVKRG